MCQISHCENSAGALLKWLDGVLEFRLSQDYLLLQISKISNIITDCREKTNGDISAKQMCKCFILMSNLRTIFFLLWQLRHFFIWWRIFKQNQPKTPIKVLHTCWFKTDFAVTSVECSYRTSASTLCLKHFCVRSPMPILLMLKPKLWISST